MKNYKSKILIAAGLITLIAACKKSEKFPVDKVSGIYVFDPRDSAGANALKYLLNIYDVMKLGHNRVNGDYLDAASDDAVSAVTGSQVSILATGGYTSVDLPDGENIWSVTNSTNDYNMWNGIRYANEFIAGIPVVPVADKIINGKVNGIGVSTRYIWQNEARFLRAYFYFELVKRWGGVPLLGDKVYNINDNLTLPRNSFADCISYIVSECDAVKNGLITYPLTNPAQDNYRATQGAAMALKAKALLYAASPAFNGGSSNSFTGYPSYSANRWSLAASAAADVMKLQYQLDPNFKNIFLTQNDPEVIFIRTANHTGPSSDIETANGPVGYGAPVANGITNPTQDLVDAFPMINGKPITDTASHYDPNNPYDNRDPRFEATVLYNGHLWLTTSLQTYEGGISKPNNGRQQTVTGYYMHKFMGNQEGVSGSNFANHDEDWVIFRLAEMKLDFAEARNETSGPTDSVYQQLKDLRSRAGISQGGDGMYGLTPGMTQDQMRAVIQNERRIEMAFEEQRYFDIRRWKIADKVMNVPLRGVSIINSNGQLTYNYVPVFTPKFDATKMNVYPIPYKEILGNPAIGTANQNPGWGF